MARRTGTDKVEGAGSGSGTALEARKAQKAALRGRLEGTLAGAFLKVGGSRGAMDLALLAYGQDAELTAIADIWYELSPSQQAEIQLEELCGMVKLHPADFIGRIASWSWRMGRPLTDLMLALKAPELTERALQFAMEEKGFKDREAILRRMGVYPDKSPLVQVSQSQQVVNQGPQLTRFEDQTVEFEESEVEEGEEV